MTISEVVIFGFAVWYLTHIFVLKEDGTDTGPLRSSTKVILTFDYQTNTMSRRPVNLFDRIRSLFGVYRDTDKEEWTVREDAPGPWFCPICLSFWVSLLLTFIYLIVPFIAFYIIGFAGVASFLSSLLNAQFVLRGGTGE